MNKPLVDSILEHIHPDKSESERIDDTAFDKTENFVQSYFKTDYATLIYNSVESNFDLRKAAILLDILIWSTPDNGTKLDQLTHNWISSEDQKKVKLMLYRFEWLPDSQTWPQISEEIILKFPNLKMLVNYYSMELESSKSGYRNIEKLEQIIRNCS